MNRPTHFEIQCDDTARGVEFYKQVFGWDIQKWESPLMEYWMVMTAPKNDKSEGINGGLLKRQGPPPVEGAASNSFVCTMVVDAIDETLNKLTSNGGKIVVAKFAFPGMAWQAYCKDTEGNVFGLHQKDKNAA